MSYVRTMAIPAMLALAASCSTETTVDNATELPTTVAPEEKVESSPRSKDALPEQGMRVSVPTHCGVVSLKVKGQLWLAAPRLGGHNPPRGWNEHAVEGTLIEVGPGHAVFAGDGGERAKFELAPEGVHDPNEGCE